MEELRARVLPLLVDALVPRGAGIADVGAAQLPDDPVRCLDPTIHCVVKLRVLLQHLEALGKLPLRGDQSPVACDPWLLLAMGELVDSIGLLLRGVVLP